jgi:hypothetical protein
MGTQRIELTGGGWADLRDDPERISNRDRRPVFEAWYAQTVSPWVDQDRAVRALLPWAVAAWDVKDAAGQPLPLPRERAGVLDDLTAADYDRLFAAVVGWLRPMFPNFTGDTDTALEDGSPTSPLASSSGGPRATTPTAPPASPENSGNGSAPTSSSPVSAGPSPT